MLISSVITFQCNRLAQVVATVWDNITCYKNRKLEVVPASGAAAHFLKPAAVENNKTGSLSLAYSVGNVQEEEGDEDIDPRYMTAKQYKQLEVQSENTAPHELGGPQDGSRPDEGSKKPQCMGLKEWRTMAGLESSLDQSDGLSSGETELSVPEPIYAAVIKRVKWKEPVTVQQPEQEALKELAAPTVQEFQDEAARCRVYCRVVNVPLFEEALKASGYELAEKVNAMEASYVKSYNDTLLFYYEKNSGNAPSATILRQAHYLANDAALGDVKALGTEDAEGYADVWSQFTMNFGANDMPINYSLRSNRFAYRPMPPLPVNVPGVNNETKETRL